MKFHAESLASRFPDARTVKTNVDLVDFASQFTCLHKSGRQWVGLCPLHRERRPSFFGSSPSTGLLLPWMSARRGHLGPTGGEAGGGDGDAAGVAFPQLGLSGSS
jgi:CHC2 zinc finger